MLATAHPTLACPPNPHPNPEDLRQLINKQLHTPNQRQCHIHNASKTWLQMQPTTAQHTPMPTPMPPSPPPTPA
jgi:hypothetical protein